MQGECPMPSLQELRTRNQTHVTQHLFHSFHPPSSRTFPIPHVTHANGSQRLPLTSSSRPDLLWYFSAPIQDRGTFYFPFAKDAILLLGVPHVIQRCWSVGQLVSSRKLIQTDPLSRLTAEVGGSVKIKELAWKCYSLERNS